MNKLIVAVCIIAVIAVIAYFLVRPKPTSQPAVEEAYLVEDSIASLLQQEFEKVSVDQSAFNAQVENEIVSSLSMFYYE
ncbi:MAG: hypothetical protein QXQ69_01345 [Candidatus Aenigmatarchaeota archaeon]